MARAEVLVFAANRSAALVHTTSKCRVCPNTIMHSWLKWKRSWLKWKRFSTNIFYLPTASSKKGDFLRDLKSYTAYGFPGECRDPGLVELFFCAGKDQIKNQAEYVYGSGNLENQSPRVRPLQNQTTDKYPNNAR